MQFLDREQRHLHKVKPMSLRHTQQDREYVSYIFAISTDEVDLQRYS